MSTRPARRGTTNTNDRGNSRDRLRRKLWLLREFGNGIVAACAFGCGVLVDLDTITVDRIVPKKYGGTYKRDNIRPACGPCNSRDGSRLARENT